MTLLLLLAALIFLAGLTAGWLVGRDHDMGRRVSLVARAINLEAEQDES